MAPQPQPIRYDGIHCNLALERHSDRVVLVRIAGTDIGEFVDMPTKALSQWLADSVPIEPFIDARDVRGAWIEVSGDWVAWLTAHRQTLRSVVMLNESRLIHITAEFVRRFTGIEGIMSICTEPAVFDAALAQALNSASGRRAYRGVSGVS
jgi:hypothetical protein